MRFILFSILYLAAHLACAQNAVLPDAIRSSKNEYSGMCLHNGKVFLLPQSKKPGTPFTGYIHSIDLSKISLDEGLRVKVSADEVHTINIINLQEVARTIPHFEGFEAICMVNNTVFLTVETESDTDYIVKGYLHNNAITLAAKTLPVSKPRKDGARLTNAGLEGMAFHNGKLLIAFEYNYFGAATSLFLADTSFSAPVTTTPFTELPFRLTDICSNGQGGLLAINHYWNFAGNMAHKETYYKNIDPSRDPDLKHWTPGECFTRIIELKPTATGFTWQTKKVISNKDCINWEGMVPYKGGVLLISDDNKIPFLETKFRCYFL